jgi:RimJ/RimL family protein N-acetyltransferase
MRLPTEIGRLTLRSHVPADAENLQRLLAENADHLLSSGDYRDEIAATVEQWRGRFDVDGDVGAVAYSFGMWLDDEEMIGRIVLMPVDAPSYGLGYWVANPQQGKGFASASVLAIVDHAASLGATEVFAGVNHGNVASRRVLEKCGFVEVAELDAYTRFRRQIDPLG